MQMIKMNVLESQESFTRFYWRINSMDYPLFVQQNKKIAKILVQAINKFVGLQITPLQKYLHQIVKTISQKFAEFPSNSRQQCAYLLNALSYYEQKVKQHSSVFIQNNKFEFTQLEIQEEKMTVNPEIQRSLEDEHWSREKNEQFYQEMNINNAVSEITQWKLPLLNYLDLCCSKLLYFQWKIGNSETSSMDFILIENLQDKQKFKQQLERTICAGLNEKNGLIILVGCTLELKRNGFYKTIKEVTDEYKNEEERKNFKQMIDSFSFISFFSDQDYQIAVDFVGVYPNPLKTAFKNNQISVVPRVKVLKKYQAYPYYIQNKGQSEKRPFYELYVCERKNNFKVVTKVTGQNKYDMVIQNMKYEDKVYFNHWGSECISSFEVKGTSSEIFNISGKAITMKFSSGKQENYKKVNGQFASFDDSMNIAILINKKTVVKRKQEDLRNIINQDYVLICKEIHYQTKEKEQRMAFILAHTKSHDKIMEVITNFKLMDDFQVEEVTIAITLSEKENVNLNEFEIWEKFESIFHLNYQTKIKKKYNEENCQETEDYICLQNKQQSLFAFLILNYLQFIAKFASVNLNFGSLKDINE